jgi:hypothetical protein
MRPTPAFIGDASAAITERLSRPYRRVVTALRISAWGGGLLLLVTAIGMLLFLHRGDPEGSARVANQEIEFLMQRGENVQRRAPVMQRRWWNYFRVTHGVLAASDRRLIFVGVPPEQLFPHEDEPAELEEASWEYGALLPARRRRVLFNTRAGLTLGGGDSRTTFAVMSRDAARLDSVVAYMDRRIELAHAAREAERRAAEIAAAAARQPVYHLVQRGEALDVLATRYGTTVDSLRAWNRLRRDRILVGQRLLVKPGS